MLKNGLLIISALFLVMLFNLPASAASVVGKWSVSGKCTAKATISGKSYTLKDTIKDKFTFKKNNKFSMIDMNGTWRLKNGRFVIYINTSKIESYVEEFFSSEGYDVEIDITSFTFGGTATSKKISGKFILKATIYVSGKGSGTASLSWPFSGTRVSSTTYDTAAPVGGKPLMHAIQEVLPQMVSGAALPFDTSPDEPAEDLDIQ